MREENLPLNLQRESEMSIQSKIFHFRKMTTIATTTLCLICSIPQQAFCEATSIERITADLLDFTKAYPDMKCLDDLNMQWKQENSFKNLGELILNSENPQETYREFFENFFAQIGNQYGLQLTLPEVFAYLQQNIDMIPSSEREIVQNALFSIQNAGIYEVCGKFYWPWEWNWFGLNKQNKKHQHHTVAFSSTLPDPTAVIIYTGSIAALTLVAIFRPQAMAAMTEALIKISNTLFEQKK